MLSGIGPVVVVTTDCLYGRAISNSTLSGRGDVHADMNITDAIEHQTWSFSCKHTQNIMAEMLVQLSPRPLLVEAASDSSAPAMTLHHPPPQPSLQQRQRRADFEDQRRERRLSSKSSGSLGDRRLVSSI